MTKAVVFDLDGMVVESAYDWPEIRRRLGAGLLPILSCREALDRIQVLPQECCAADNSPFDAQAALEAGIRLVF